MTNTVFGRLFYLNNYSFCASNTYLRGVIPNCIDTCLYAKDDSYLEYLKSLKEIYNPNNYMFILESIINYVIKIFNATYQDYIKNGCDEYTEQVLKNIMTKHNNILDLYTKEFDIELAKKEKKEENRVYRKTKYKKHYVYKIVNNQMKR